ncbi:uncharacterized protein LOC128261570 [Drosophila gunungcola]|uniref:uncharacterized protein LOC128261570 n=1 Tax=Drosophila gunungcola TaxID=103775 RepID=UPI0022E4B230|nr:uncharacterized protein LOC128261570 [Drosophila gunungcola]
MTITDWNKWSLEQFRNEPQLKPKLIPGFDRLDNRLRAVLREQDLQSVFHKRKPAGGGQKQGKSKKFKRTPRAYDIQQVYDERRKELSRLAKVQGVGNQFRSRPVPNFERSHQRLERRKLYLNSLQKLTKPRCPGTLFVSMEALHKRQKQERQSERLTDFTPRINPKSSMDYLHRQPFIPRIDTTYTRPKPFHLHTSERALSRRLYDEQKKWRMDQKLEQKASDCFKRERKEFLKLRKTTNFKATPNPWTRVSAAYGSQGS